MDFGDAIRALKDGKRVTRAGWNGKGMWLVLLGFDADWFKNGFEKDVDLKGAIPQESICMKTAQNTFVIGWLASQTDMLADDWVLVDG